MTAHVDAQGPGCKAFSHRLPNTIPSRPVTPAEQARARTLRAAFIAAVLIGSCYPCIGAELNFHQRHFSAGGGTLRAAASSGSTFVVGGDDGIILVSGDGRDWMSMESGTRHTLHGAAFGWNRFVVVGDRGTIRWSDDGRVWRAATDSGTRDHLYSVTFGKGRFVAVGDYGVVVTSGDGENWTEAPRLVLSPLRSVNYGPGMFLAGGEDGVIVHSYYGDVWSKSSTGATGLVTGIASHPNGFVAITENGQPLGGFLEWRLTPPPALPTNGARMLGTAIATETAIAVGERGTVLTFDVLQAMGGNSPGEWGARVPVPASAADIHFHASIFAQDTFLIVGENQTILQSDPIYPGGLRNISVRAQVGVGERALIGGFAIRGQAAKRILVRAAGPALANFGVARPLPNPSLALFDGAGALLAANIGWATAETAVTLRTAATQAGAFPFAEGSADCALVQSLPPGIYTAQVSSADSATGVALLEFYDLDAEPLQSRIMNLSARAYIEADSEPMIPGVTTSGWGRTLLMRAIGPGLSAFGVSSPLPDPRFRTLVPGLPPGIHWPGSPPTAGPWYDTWHAALGYAHAYSPDDIREMTARLGAFPLAEGSRDAAGLFAKGAGSMTTEVGDATGTSGIVLFEVYDATGL